MDFADLLERLELSNFITIQLTTSGIKPQTNSIHKIVAIHFKNAKKHREWIGLVKDN